MINETDIKDLEPGFYEWLDELEAFSTRSERLYDDFFEVKDLNKLRSWLEAAYMTGVKYALRYKKDS